MLKINEYAYRHGTKKKLRNSKGCTNHAQPGGVCMRHGAKKRVVDELCAEPCALCSFDTCLTCSIQSANKKVKILTYLISTMVRLSRCI
jgi:hypothetical protein